MFHQCGYVVSDNTSHEELTVAGRRNGSSLVVGIGAGTDDGGVPTRPGVLERYPPVGVPAAKSPQRSRTAAPTVPPILSLPGIDGWRVIKVSTVGNVGWVPVNGSVSFVFKLWIAV